MVLVPPYVEVDGFVVPLDIWRADWRGPAVMRQHSSPDRPFLKSLMYVVNGLLGRDQPDEMLALLAARKKLPMPDGLVAAPVTEGFEDYADSAKNWERAAGYPPDLRDVYYIGTNFLKDDLVIPRETFIKLMKQLYALDAAVRSGAIEAKLDDSIAVPPPLPEPPAPPPLPWDDMEYIELEERLAALDEDDPLTDALVDPVRAQRASRLRGSLFALLEVAWWRTRDGIDDLPGRARAAGWTTLCGYVDALEALVAYLDDPERLAVTGSPRPDSPFAADVSVDLFRLPPAARPPEVGVHAWLARCEAAFVADRGPPENVAGDLFTRIGSHRVRMRYRVEVGSHLCLWRVELI